MGERETSHCRDFHPTSYQQLVRLHPRRQERKENSFPSLRLGALCAFARKTFFVSFCAPLKIGGWQLLHPSCVLPIKGRSGAFPLDGGRLDRGERLAVD